MHTELHALAHEIAVVVVVVVVVAVVVLVALAHVRSIVRFTSAALAFLSAWPSAHVMNSTGMVMSGHGSPHPILLVSSRPTVL